MRMINNIRNFSATLLFLCFTILLYIDLLYQRVQITEEGKWRFYSVEPIAQVELILKYLVSLSLLCAVIFLLFGFLSKFAMENQTQNLVSGNKFQYFAAWSFISLLGAQFFSDPLGQLFFFLATFVVGIWLMKNRLDLLGISSIHLGRILLWIPFYLIILLLLQKLVVSFLEEILFVDTYSEREVGLSEGLQVPDQMTVIINILVTCVGAPLSEEMIFRGYLQRYFLQKWGKWVAILLSAFFFSLYHVDLASLLQIFVIGIFLGLIREWHQSLWAPIMLHVFNNVLATLWDFGIRPSDLLFG